MRSGDMPNPEHATGGAAAAPAAYFNASCDSARPADTPLLVDVRFGEALDPSWRDLGAIIGTAVVVGILAAALWSWTHADSAVLIGAFIVAAFLIWWVLKWSRSGMAARVARTCERIKWNGILKSVTAALHRAQGMGAEREILALMQGLATHGVANTTIRAVRRREFTPFEPLTVPFEPQPLGAGHAGLGHDDHAGSGCSPMARTILRNIALKGGWGILIAWGLMWIQALIMGYFSRRVLGWIAWANFGVFTLLILWVLFIPFGFAQLYREWLVVPGGLVSRESGWFQSRWVVHLFDRRKSVLCVCRLRGKRWGAFVADGQSSSRTIATKEEIDFLLSAWFSPLPAPSRDQLADLE